MVQSFQSAEEEAIQESSAPPAPMVQGFDYTVPLLMLAVVVLGAFNNLLGRMRAVPLGEYDFFTAVLNAVVYVIVWSTVFLSRRYTFKVTPKEQADFVWSVRGKWSLLMFGGLGDAIGGLLGFIGQPYVSGVMYSLMNQAIVRRALSWSSGLHTGAESTPHRGGFDPWPAGFAPQEYGTPRGCFRG